jgi:predicted RecB family nuclease
MKLLSGSIQLSPTDLANHLGCVHLTELNRQVVIGKRSKLTWMDPAVAVLAKRGEEHEAMYVAYLAAQGLTVENIQAKGMQATIDAMKNGVDVIVQAELSEKGWTGRADILIKTVRPSAIGNWSYEVQDTKLSRNTRAATILQLCLYAEIVGNIQGHETEFMHVIKPGTPFEKESFRYDDFKAYYRYSKATLLKVIESEPAETYPQPVQHCGICRWWKECDQQRHDDDHLSLVANIRAMHIGELEKNQIRTLEAFANQDLPVKKLPERGSIESYRNIHGQAKVQLRGRQQKKLVHELLPPEAFRGLARLPQPSPGDIYFDIEGDPFFGQGGIEYLLGYAFVNESGKLEYQKIWAKNREEEKAAFEGFMQFVMNRLKKYKDLHIYHFAPYEPSTVKRLTGRYGIRENDLDGLLRGERFVDLYAIIKESLRASVERYSLKDLEKFTDYNRKIELQDASAARRTVEFALELNDISSVTPEIFSIVEEYNADDCFATHALHGWLELLREESIQNGQQILRPELKTGEATENIEEVQIRAKSLYDGLVAALPADRSAWNEFHQAQWLLANQIDYFRRESKSAWWEFFRLHEMGSDDLLNERKGIAGLTFVGEVKAPPRVRSVIHQYQFPPQEVGLTEGDSVHQVMGIRIGSVHAIDLEKCTIEIKKSKEATDIHPSAIHQEEVVTIEPLATSIFDLAQHIIEDGIQFPTPYRAAKDLLLKNGPRLANTLPGKILGDGEDAVAGAVRIATEMKGTVLGIQGPPGSGKTYTGAMMILQLAQQGKRIGIAAPSHKVIRNLFDKVLELGQKSDMKIKLVHKVKEKSDEPKNGLEETTENKQALKALDDHKVVGGTAWLWAHNDARETLDYLFVDEAGQMSLAHVLAASRCTKNLVLLGDPQQLEQPQKASHPEGADVAALSHLLDGHKTMPDDKGIFLATTRRLHPAITDFTSEVFYEKRLRSLPGLDRQKLIGNHSVAGAGLFYNPVVHHGNQNRSLEEVAEIKKLVHELVATTRWTNREGTTGTVTFQDILIVAPYNAQVAALSDALPECRVGTVDKFQGQEAAIVIYSMTSSSAQDAPRGMNFLFNPNRLNVATSRAMCACILVLSPRLLETECRTVDQMKWVNALCLYKEKSQKRQDP